MKALDRRACSQPPAKPPMNAIVEKMMAGIAQHFAAAAGPWVNFPSKLRMVAVVAVVWRGGASRPRPSG